MPKSRNYEEFVEKFKTKKTTRTIRTTNPRRSKATTFRAAVPIHESANNHRDYRLLRRPFESKGIVTASKADISRRHRRQSRQTLHQKA